MVRVQEEPGFLSYCSQPVMYVQIVHDYEVVRIPRDLASRLGRDLTGLPRRASEAGTTPPLWLPDTHWTWRGPQACSVVLVDCCYSWKVALQGVALGVWELRCRLLLQTEVHSPLVERMQSLFRERDMVRE